MRKVLLSLGALAAVAVALPMFSAFEAHVINVTATIENALTVPVESLDFGTVFPQERLDKTFSVSLSQSFQDEDRVDDVEYVLRQKPKCQRNDNASQELPPFGQVTEDQNGQFVCKDQANYHIMPFLCPYLSKQELTPEDDVAGGENDMQGLGGWVGPLFSFHGPTTLGQSPVQWDLQTTLAYQLSGRLAKSDNDFSDTWNIDLKVPCFGGHCAQDWATFVNQNGGAQHNANPADYVQPIEDEHKLYGCDLWLEVTGISLKKIGCNATADVMLVLDRSGSIDAGELTALKTAAHAFVDALAPTPAGVHMGQSSFASTGSLDQTLTGVEASIEAAIDALTTGGSTDLEAGITLAIDELASVRDRTPDTDGDFPDYIVVITDGNPNVPNSAQAEADAAAAAAAARAAGIEVFVVGVGNDVDAAFLINNIADDPAHYFAVVDYATLTATLQAIANCEPAPAITGSLTVTKVMGNPAGPKTPVDFPLTVSGINISSGTPINLVAGSYVVAEAADPNYDAVFSGDCDVSGNVTIGVGESKSCTITNTYDPQPVNLLSTGFGTGTTDTTFDENPSWTEGGAGAEKRNASGGGNDSASPNGGRFAIMFGTNGWICRSIDATGYNSLTLSYYWRGDTDAEAGDNGIVEYATGGTCASPTGLTTLATHSLTTTTWSALQNINLPGSLNGTTFLLRYRTASSQTDEHFRVDGVTLAGTPN